MGRVKELGTLETNLMRFGDFCFSKMQKGFIPLHAGGDWPKGNYNYPKLLQSNKRLAQAEKSYCFSFHELWKNKAIVLFFYNLREKESLDRVNFLKLPPSGTSVCL